MHPRRVHPVKGAVFSLTPYMIDTGFAEFLRTLPVLP